jgi:hypothetical protein
MSFKEAKNRGMMHVHKIPNMTPRASTQSASNIPRKNRNIFQQIHKKREKGRSKKTQD